MADMPQDSPRFSPDDALPPVQPPDAQFLVKLFLIPAGIVTALAVAWLAVVWLVRSGSDPYSYLDALERNNAVRWQAAYNLAEALRDPRHADLRHDPKLAQRLTEILGRELDAHRTEKEDLQLQVFLCGALGRFQLPEVVLPVLVRAADPANKADASTRFAALRAVASVVADSPSFARGAHPEVLELALREADADAPNMRSTSAFVLSAYGGPQAQQRLQGLVADRFPDVRYNAATMLARMGDDRAVPVLLEMLNPDERAGIDVEDETKLREAKRLSILMNGLRGAKQLVEHNATVDRTKLAAAAERLSRESDLGQVALEAKIVAQELAAAPAQSTQTP
ncbi:MAG: HEAT repeat domain-containing protein [Planctomycetes bacterium]|nr:HEAT repeat domain-containing protein [Planctomycetota bacterium]